jgi:hypothetical protein
METSEQKMKVWQRHPSLTILGALIVNLCIVIPCGYIGCLIEDHNVSDPSESSAHIFGLMFFAFVFSIFMVAVYLTGWGVDSRFMRVCVIIGTSLALMAAWFICLLILVFIGIGFLARLYS